MSKRPCLKCNGKGATENRWHQRLKETPDNPIYQNLGKDPLELCKYACDGSGYYEAPDFHRLFDMVKGKVGLRFNRPYFAKGEKRKAMQPLDRILEDRAYYVWRMVRFHSGIDVTLPVMAVSDVRHDPFKAELDKYIDELALKFYGSNMRGANRWRPLLVGDNP